jgi:hypothetical protein
MLSFDVGKMYVRTSAASPWIWIFKNESIISRDAQALIKLDPDMPFLIVREGKELQPMGGCYPRQAYQVLYKDIVGYIRIHYPNDLEDGIFVEL